MHLKKCVTVILLLVLVLCNTSCAERAVPAVEETDVMYMTHMSESHQISVQIPQSESDTVHALVQNFITERLRSDCEFTEVLTLSATDIESDIQGDYSGCFADIDCEIVGKTEERISILFSGIFNRKTAAHPNRCFFTLNIDPVTGRRLMFKDMYAVNEELYECFLSYAESADEQRMSNADVSELCSKERFLQGLEDEKEYSTYFTQTGVGFGYPVAHAVGDYQTVEIPYEELNMFRL